MFAQHLLSGGTTYLSTSAVRAAIAKFIRRHKADIPWFNNLVSEPSPDQSQPPSIGTNDPFWTTTTLVTIYSTSIHSLRILNVDNPAPELTFV
jgi:hypothetical protein